MSHGSFAIFFTRPIAATLVIIGLASLALPALRGVARWLRPTTVSG
jgi:TctA family transporter